jgi:hypothetical protein
MPDIEVKPDAGLSPITKYLRRLASQEWYGIASLTYSRGRVILMNLNQSLKPETIQQLVTSTEESPRSQNGTNNSKQQ